jgi:hypothetical protein
MKDNIEKIKPEKSIKKKKPKLKKKNSVDDKANITPKSREFSNDLLEYLVLWKNKSSSSWKFNKVIFFEIFKLNY